jgi:hypothetical protein
MRGYECHHYKMIDSKKKILEKCDNSACWAGINGQIREGVEDIYIEKFKEPETEIYIKHIVGIINKVTPCKLVSIKKTVYIKYKLLKKFDKDLILLNFLRNLWNKNNIPYRSLMSLKNDERINLESQYTLIFFKTLKSNFKIYKDPVQRLTHANFIACKTLEITNSPTHSNVHNYTNLKIKDTKSLLESKFNSTMTFLTT